MERKCQRNGKFFSGKIVNSRNYSAGADGYIAHGEILPVLIRQHSEKLQKILVVIERFSGSHHNDMGNLLTGQTVYGIDFLQDFPGQQISSKSIQRRGAEPAPHPAANLRGHTRCCRICIS